MRLITSHNDSKDATITSYHDPIPAGLWAAAAILAVAAAAARPAALLAAAAATLGPFLTLAGIICCSALAGRAGMFRLLARLLIPDRAPRAVASTAVLGFTALLSALANIDIAVLAALPAALAAATRCRIDPARLTVAVAITANATSFLLPTSNITGLLLLGRAPLSTTAYLRGSWAAWLLVTLVTIVPLSAWLSRHETGQEPVTPPSGLVKIRLVLDLVPMYLAASAIRTLLAGGITLPAGYASQLAGSTALTAVVSNLPAAAGLHPAGQAGLWAAIAGTAIGPNLLLTGSVATVISRRIARQAGTTLSARLFTTAGAALIPAQFAVATLGLHLTGAIR